MTISLNAIVTGFHSGQAAEQYNRTIWEGARGICDCWVRTAEANEQMKNSCERLTEGKDEKEILVSDTGKKIK